MSIFYVLGPKYLTRACVLALEQRGAGTVDCAAHLPRPLLPQSSTFNKPTPRPFAGGGWGEGNQNGRFLNSRPLSPPPSSSPIRGGGEIRVPGWKLFKSSHMSCRADLQRRHETYAGFLWHVWVWCDTWRCF